jgi:hypothetical protein
MPRRAQILACPYLDTVTYLCPPYFSKNLLLRVQHGLTYRTLRRSTAVKFHNQLLPGGPSWACRVKRLTRLGNIWRQGGKTGRVLPAGTSACLLSDMHGDVKAARVPTSGPASVQANYAYQLPTPYGRSELVLSTAMPARTRWTELCLPCQEGV